MKKIVNVLYSLLLLVNLGLSYLSTLIYNLSRDTHWDGRAIHTGIPFVFSTATILVLGLLTIPMVVVCKYVCKYHNINWEDEPLKMILISLPLLINLPNLIALLYAVLAGLI